MAYVLCANLVGFMAQKDENLIVKLILSLKC